MRRFLPYMPLMFLSLVILHRWSNTPASFAFNVTWIKPSLGDIYAPGTHLIGEWQVDGSLINATFRLCSHGGLSYGQHLPDRIQCGASVRPTMQHSSDNDSFQTTL